MRKETKERGNTMKFACSRDALLEAITIVQKAVPSKSTMPILEGILLEAEEGHIKLSSNDLEIAIECIIDADVERMGKAVLYSRTFGEVIRKISGDEIYVDMNEFAIISIQSRYSQFELKSIDPEGFPKMADVAQENVITISRDALKNVIRQTAFAVSDDENRPIFKGVFVEIDENYINFVATDGYKLAYRKEESNQETFGFSCIIPGKTLNEIYKILQNVSEEIDICIANNQMLFQAGNCKLVSRLIEGTYLNYKIMIPKESSLTAVVNTKELLAAIERASIVMNDERKNPLNFTIGYDKIVLTANAENGSAKEEVVCETLGDKLDIRFNARNLLETLKVIDDEQIKLLFTTNVGPCSVVPVEGNMFTYLIMPLKTMR